MTTADVTRRADGDDLAGGQPAGRHWPAAGGGFLLGAARGHPTPVPAARAADVALLGNRTAIGLGVRLQQLTVLRFAPVLLTSASAPASAAWVFWA